MGNLLVSAGLVLGLVVLPASCKKDDKKKSDPPPAEKDNGKEDPAKAAGGEEPAGGHGSGTGAGSGGGESMVNKMMHCPSAVEGATTTVTASETAVMVTIASDDKAKAGEIQKRAEHLASLTADTAAEIKHSGQGTGGGALGKCPVVMKDVTVKAAANDNGVVVTLTPKDAAKLGDLTKAATERAAAMASKDGDDAGEDDEEDEEDEEGGW